MLIDVPPEVTADLDAAARADLAAAAFRAKELAKLSVPAGMLSGLIAGVLYNRYSDIRLPSYLAFFGGRRFVPIVCGFAGLFLAPGFRLRLARARAAAWMPLSQAVLGSESVGLFIYGVLNRVLIVTGPAPHHQQHRLVPARRLQRRHRRPQALLRRRSQRGRVHVAASSR